jgi:hypothetical protein
MKKLIIVLCVMLFSVTGFSQKFFGPVDKNMFNLALSKTPLTAIAGSTWLFRPVVQISAIEFLLTNPVQVASFSSLGTGVSYVHFIEQNGEPYANLGINALVLFTENPGGTEAAKLSFALSVSALQFVNVGVGYSLKDKKAFILTGITINFN